MRQCDVTDCNVVFFDHYGTVIVLESYQARPMATLENKLYDVVHIYSYTCGAL